MPLVNIGTFHFSIPEEVCCSFFSPFFLQEASAEIDFHVKITNDIPSYCYILGKDGFLKIPSSHFELYLERSLAHIGLLRRETYLVIHSALLQMNHKGYLFLGKSESGKSTLSQKMSRVSILGSDESNIITEKNKEYYALSTPFGSFKKRVVVPQKIEAPLERVFLLEKEFLRPTWKEHLIDRDMLWQFLVTGQTKYPKAELSLYAKYNAMVNTFANKCEAYILHHNMASTPEQVKEVITDES